MIINDESYECLFKCDNTIITGDFNAHNILFGASTNNAQGIAIESLLDTYNFCCRNTGEDTYTKHDGGVSLLDITMISAALTLQASWSVHSDPLSSNHLPVHTALFTTTQCIEYIVNKWNFKRVNHPVNGIATFTLQMTFLM